MLAIWESEMSLLNLYWGDRGHCPKCGRFVGDIVGYVSEVKGVTRVEGTCRWHGIVDITHQEWSYSDFVDEETA